MTRSRCLLLGLRNAADEKPTVIDRHADAEESTAADLIVVHLGHSTPGVLAVRVRHEAVAAVRAAEVHHQTELVDGSAALERRHQLVLVAVARNFADEDLAASRRRRAGPVWRRTVLSLPVLLQSCHRAERRRKVNQPIKLF